MKILIFGKSGQIAWELRRSCSLLGDVRFYSKNEVNFESKDKIVKAIRDFKPAQIINAAAYTDVDKAESEKEKAFLVNGTAVGIIAEECKKIDCFLVHYSTDYVFNGRNQKPYKENDLADPLSVYGLSKLAGEKYVQQINIPHIIVRTSWVYGSKGKNFLLTILRLGAERDILRVVNDQIGNPTWSRHIADATAHIIKDPDVREKTGVYNMSSGGCVSWFGFAQKIFEIHQKLNLSYKSRLGLIEPITSQQYLFAAKRPPYSCLNNDKLEKNFNLKLPSWDFSLNMMMESLELI